PRSGHMTIDEFIQDATQRMDKSVESAQHEFNTLRTGRASAALLDRIQIDYYGTKTPLKQLATINAPEPRLLTVQPFDPSYLPTIERTIKEADLGLTPAHEGRTKRGVSRLLPTPHGRQARPPADSAADRGAAQGARQGRAADGRG